MTSARMQFCLKAATSLSENDLDDLTDAIGKYIDAGVSREQAETMAVDDLTRQIMGERDALLAAGREQFPDVFPSDVDMAAAAAATSPENDLPAPTAAQKEAGNYKMGHLTLHGLDITIENPKGSERRAVDGSWVVRSMPAHYGYFKRTEGADGDHVDAFIGPNPESTKVWVINQKHQDGGFDEHKVMLGYDSADQAMTDYLLSFSDNYGAKVYDSMSRPMTVEDLRTVLPRMKERRPVLDAKAPAKQPDGPSDQFKRYEKSIRESDTVGSGMLEQIRMDERLKDGESEKLLALAAPKTESREPAKRKPAKVIDNGATNPGEFIVRDEGTNLASFFINDKGRAVKVKYFFESQQTRDHALDAINAFVAARAPAQPPAPKSDKAEIRPYRRSDGSIGYEAVPIVPAETVAAPAGGANTVFTEDAAAAARERLRKKLSGRLTSGIDPEMLQDGLTLAGYHVERGARTFKAFARAMIADLGEAVRPYLKSWYMGVKYDPRAAAFDGMSSAAEVEAADVDAIGGDDAGSMDAPGGQALADAPAGPVPGTAPVGPAAEGTAGGGRADRQGNGGSSGVGVGSRAGLGNDPAEVPVPARGSRAEGAGRGADRQPDVRRDERPEPGALADRTGDRLAASDTPAGQPEQPAAANHTIGEADGVGTGGDVAKFKGNIEAIELLRTLEAENRPAGPDEAKILARYVGWGGLKQAFRPKSGRAIAKGWEKRVEQLEQLLSAEEYEAANRSILDAHYTSVPVVQAMWDVARYLGFRGGRVQETSMGTGNFFGLMPADLRANSALTGVELDSLTARIAKKLYPQANVLNMGYQDARFPNEWFDLTVGNPPFGDQAIPYGDSKHLKGFSIHNFMFAKAIDKLAPGGLHIQVVSHNFLDATNSEARAYIAHRARLVGALRLPKTAFESNAGTEVVTDIVILQKLPENRWGNERWAQQWVPAGERELPTDEGPKRFSVSQYFIDNPGMILGRESTAGTMYGPNEYTVEPTGDLAGQIRDAIAALPAGIFDRDVTPASINQSMAEALGKVERDSGAFEVENDLLYRVNVAGDGSVSRQEVTAKTPWSEKQTWGEQRIARAIGMTRLRDITRRLLAAEAGDRPAMMLSTLRQELNEVYDAFVKAHGFVNDRQNEQVFRDDPESPLVFALEADYDPGVSAARAKTMGIPQRKASAKKMPVFERRVIEPYSPPTSAANARDALSISLSEKGSVDPAYMASLTGESAESLLRELTEAEPPILFLNPQTQGYEPSDQYLAGNVKAKYQAAMSAGLSRNAEALRAVFPPDLSAGDIRARLGAPWVAESDYADFIRHLIGDDAKARVSYFRVNGGFSVTSTGGNPTLLNTKWGTPRRDAVDLVTRLMNGKDFAVFDTGADDKRVLNKEATDVAIEKAAEVAREFEEWLFKDIDRRERLVQHYNDHFNTNVEPKYDGSMLKLPGKVPDAIIKLRRHQVNAIWRIIRDGKALLDHVVGAGKTFTIIAAAMEMRRMGLAKKPMIAVPNHLVEQWAADVYRLYPGAKILAMRKKDFEKSNRRRMLAKVATGDWDLVIVAHSSFGFIKNDPEVEKEFFEEQIAEIQRAIEAARKSEGKKGRTERDFQKTKLALEAKFQALLDKPKDDLLSFQELGVDQLFVDESHEFKNLFFTTQRRGTGGFGNPNGSKKAADLFMKSRWMQRNRQGRGVVFATGTPVSNSLTELYTVQRYLGLGELESRGLLSLDSWLNSFGSIYSDYELDGTGIKYKRKERLRALTNVPEVIAMYRQFGDPVTLTDIQNNYREDNNGAEFPVPKIKGGKRNNVVVPRSSEQADYFATIVDRAMNLKAGGKDNMLAITTDARKAALDIRLVMPGAGDYPGSKTHRAADEITRIYEAGAAKKGTQLVFLDMSVPLSKADGLIKTGVKAGLKLLSKEAMPGWKDLPAAEQWERLRPMLVEAMDSDGENADGESLGDRIATFLDTDAQEVDASVNALSARFSVYDDMRAKLIERGVNPKEIAFIHDFDTDAKKQDLFDAVNAGAIRIVLGSTAKMGAGTNVQRKLIALHHMDAPWRPSDIEQREGRIIRQGNEFRIADPDFEVEIMAYATEQTYDARMWQVQEQKLIAINSLRNYSGERELEDVSSDAATAAEMKAASSGNPLILEDVQLTERIRKLEGLERRHRSGQQDMESTVRRYERIIRTYPDQIAGYEADGVKAKAYQDDPHGGNPPTATIDGQEFTSRKAAETYVTEKIEAAKEAAGEGKRAKWSITVNGKKVTTELELKYLLEDELGDMSPFAITIGGERFIRRKLAQDAVVAILEPAMRSGESGVIDLGEFAGMKLAAELTKGRFGDAIMVLTLIGEQTYQVDKMLDERQFLSAQVPSSMLSNALNAMTYSAGRAAPSRQKELETARADIENARSQIGQPFRYAGEIVEKRERLKEVKRLLSTADQPPAPAEETPLASIDEPAPWYFSALSEAVSGARLNAAPAAQWIAWLDANAAKAGVKADEIEWSGVREWLSMQEGKVTKNALVEYLDQNGVKVADTVYQDDREDQRRDDELLVQMTALGYEPDFEPGDGSINAIRRLSDGTEYEYEGIVDGLDVALYGERGEVPLRVLQIANELNGLAYNRSEGVADGNSVRWKKWTLPADERFKGYREILLRLPGRNEGSADALGGEPRRLSRQEASEELGVDPEQLGDIGVTVLVYPAGGYIVQNNVGTYDVQLPTDERTFRTLDAAENFLSGNYPDALERGQGYWSSHWNKVNVLAHTRVDFFTAPDGKRRMRVHEIQSDWGQSERKRPGSTPPGPFIGKTDAWVGLTLKRLIALAAQEGVDEVVIINGKQAANIYGLSAVYSRLMYFQEDDGRFSIYGKEKGKVGERLVKAGVKPEDLPNLVGKEMAEKMIAGYSSRDEGEWSRRKVIDGLDLEVGGKGMRKFYDEIVPQVARDVVKRLGGAVRRAAADGMTDEVQVVIDITPKMREKVAQGVPLFSPGREKAMPDDFLDRLFKIAVQGYDQRQPVMVEARLRRITNEAEKNDGRIDVEALRRLLDDVVNRNDARALKSGYTDRARGPLWVKERLVREVRTGANPESARLALWMLDQNPSMAEGLAISFRAKGETAGTYMESQQLATIIAGASDGTIIHEILHHTERMMPDDIQAGIRAEWARQLKRQLDFAVANNLEPLIRATTLVLSGRTEDAATLIEAIREREIPWTFYQYVNPSEFWAVNGTRIMMERENMAGWVQRARQWFREFIAKVKEIFGLSSDAAVIRGLEAVLRTDGAFLQKQGLAMGMSGAFQQPGYHGTPTRGISEFSTDYVGTGEGSQAYGWGLYFTSRKAIAEAYRKALTPNEDFIKDVDAAYQAVSNALAERSDWEIDEIRQDGSYSLYRPRGGSSVNGEDAPKNVQKIVADLLKPFITEGNKGQVYQVDIPDDKDMLLWDKPVDEMPEAVRDVVYGMKGRWVTDGGARMFVDAPKAWMTGAQAYRALSRIHGGDMQASNALLDAGVKGIKYLDGVSRSKGDGTHNYVIFSGADVQVRREFYSIDPLAGENGRRDGTLAERTAALQQAVDAMNAPPEPPPTWAGPLFKDMGTFSKYAVHPRTIAAFDKAFAPVYRVAELQMQTRDRIASEFANKVQAYFDLPKASKARVHAVLELGRLKGEVLAGRAMSMTNEGEPAQLSSDGEVITLSDAEKTAYWGVRQMLNDALDRFRDQALIDFGIDPAQFQGRGISQRLVAMADAIPAGFAGNARAKMLRTAAVMVDEIEQARRTGYVPFSRFGDVVVTVKDANNATIWASKVDSTGMLNTVRKKFGAAVVTDIPAVKAEMERLRTQFAGQDVTVGAFPAQSLADGQSDVRMADIDMLAEVAQINNQQWDSIREQLERAVKAKSFRKHFFGASNTPGYSTDFERSLSDYMLGMAGYLARREALPKWDAAIAAMPTQKANLIAYAKNYRDYVQSPTEEWQRLRQFGFLMYLAGVPATALVNLTQVDLLTAPYLMQFAGAARVQFEIQKARLEAAGMISLSAGMDVFDPAKAPADVRDDLQEAWDEGFFVPLNTYELMGTAYTGSKGQRTFDRAFRTVIDAVALTFTAAERHNRVASFIAAHRIARRPGVQAKVQTQLADNALARDTLGNFSPKGFAQWVIDETHFRMGKVNRPNITRGIGAPLLQFKGYTMQALERWITMGLLQGPQGKKAMLISLGAMMLMSGFWGLPGADDLRDLLEKIYKALSGKDFDTETKLREAVVELTGSPQIAQAFSKGVTFPAGLDLSGRLGMGNIAPDTPLAMLGIPGDLLISRPSKFVERASQDNWAGAFAELAPNFVKNPLQAANWADRGVTTLRGKRVMTPDQLDKTDIGMRAIGFQPAKVTNERERQFAERRAASSVDEMRRDFYTRITQSAADEIRATEKGDATAAAAAREKMGKAYADLAKHNQSAADAERIDISNATLRRRIAEDLNGPSAVRKQARGRAEEIREVYGKTR